MKVSLASSAELYAEHRRTASRRKRAKIAAELQRRHDEWMKRPGFSEQLSWWTAYGHTLEKYRHNGGLRTRKVVNWLKIPRFDFALWLP